RFCRRLPSKGRGRRNPGRRASGSGCFCFLVIWCSGIGLDGLLPRYCFLALPLLSYNRRVYDDGNTGKFQLVTGAIRLKTIIGMVLVGLLCFSSIPGKSTGAQKLQRVRVALSTPT